LALAMFALTLGACGGSAHSDGNSPATVRHDPATPIATVGEADFISQADLVCRKLNVVLDLAKPKSASPREVAKLLPSRVEQEQRSVAELRRLKPPAKPAAFSQTWREMVRLRATLARELKEYGRAVAAGDTAAATALAHSKAQVHEELGKIGRAAGFIECSAVR